MMPVTAKIKGKKVGVTQINLRAVLLELGAQWQKIIREKK